MTQHYMNTASFPNPPIDSRVTHYFDSSTGDCYYWDGTQYQPWQPGATPQYPQVFQGNKPVTP
jgi:hypothetical protein